MSTKPSRSSRVFGYVRVSTADQARHGDSLTAQRQAILRHAKALGKTVAHVYADEGVSGSKPLEKRPAGRELLQAIKSGEIQPGDTICAMKLDRMFRNTRDAHTVAAIFKARKISLNLLDLLGGADITNDGMSEAFFGIAAVFARLEASRISERIRDAKHVQKSEERFLGGSVPFGFRKVRGYVEKDAVEQKAIAYIKKIRGTRHKSVATVAGRTRTRVKVHSLRTIEKLVTKKFPALTRGVSHTTIGEILLRR
jgi:putative DNA-invertase from lambdoid prophage Rac